MTQTVTNSTSDPELATYQWVLGGILFLVLLIFIAKTRTGYSIIYYSLVLMIVFIVVTQYQFIAQALGPVGLQAPDSGK